MYLFYAVALQVGELSQVRALYYDGFRVEHWSSWNIIPFLLWTNSSPLPFSSFCPPCGIEFPGQGSQLSPSCDQCSNSGNAGSLTHWARLGIEPASQGSRDAMLLNHCATAGTPRQTPFHPLRPSMSFHFYKVTDPPEQRWSRPLETKC